MRKLQITITSLCLILLLVTALLSGCTTVSQRTAFNTIATVEQTASLAVDGYYTLVIKGLVSTNNVPAVSSAFNQLQAAAEIAAASVEAGTNGIAPASLVIQASGLAALISNSTTNK